MTTGVAGEPVTGFIAAIDRGLARVLVGPEEAEWFFPLGTLPVGARAGVGVLFKLQGGAPVAVRLLAESKGSSDRTIEDRLTRPIALQRSRQQASATMAASRATSRLPHAPTG